MLSMKKLMFILGFFCFIGMCLGQQVVSSGGYNIKSDYSVNWILGGSLSAIDQTAVDKNRQEQLTDRGILFKVYPVPVSDFLNIEITQTDTSRFSLELYNSSGVKVISKILPWKPVMQVDVSNLSYGIYILKISKPSISEQLPGVQKVIKF